MAAVEELVEFWRRFEWKNIGSDAQIHPDDITGLPRLARAIVEGYGDPEARVGKYFACPERDGNLFHVSLAPVPYLGDLKTADIILLGLNPGAGYSDYGGDADPKLRCKLACNMRQEFTGDDRRCLALNRRYWWSSWFCWYERLLRTAVRQYAEDSRKNYAEALDAVAQRVAVIERVAYYSLDSSALHHPHILELPSAQKSLAAVHELAGREGTLILVIWGRGGPNAPGRFGLPAQPGRVLLRTCPCSLDDETRNALVLKLMSPHAG